ncbi:MAG: type III-B CRISPR module RAMP protein Cmr6 [Armatimonadota bacterium]|nr:type III-B CRISPR module RAMP protein Cmr6 [Armatimonadota bacterium]
MVRAATEPGDYAKVVEELQRRQQSLAQAAPDRILVRDATTTAPFVTGVGSEHPLENGFAFLDPYGVPYLPGSSVKGVLRRAAEELALFEAGSGWDLLALWWLFGFDATSAFVTSQDRIPQGLVATRAAWQLTFRQACDGLSRDDVRDWLEAAADPSVGERWRKDPLAFLRSLAGESRAAVLHARALHLSGSLRFWDVLVRPPAATQGRLRVDIMNPHHHKYYQDGEAPGDFRSPNPIFFLAVPSGACLTFIVEMTPVRALPQRLRESWRDLVERALRHACTWHGFGAKTAVGYGALRLDEASVDAHGGLNVSEGTPPSATPTSPAAGRVPRLVDTLIDQVNALPATRVAGEINKFVDDCLKLEQEEDRKALARAIVEKMTPREIRKRIKDGKRPDQWGHILTLAGHERG